MFGWSQEALDNTRKIASDAIEESQRHPGQWMNPLEPHLKSRVRYARTVDEILQFLEETRVDPLKAAAFAQTCSDGFFQVFSPNLSFLAGDQQVSGAVNTLLTSWYEELRTPDDGVYPDEIIRLIKQMGGIETEKNRSIKSWRSFTEVSSISGFKQFVSADRRFPIRISYPEGISFFYDFNREEYLHVDWDDGRTIFGISRQNLAKSAQRGDRDVKLLLQGKMDLSQFMQEDFAQRQANAVLLGMHSDRRKWWIEDRVVGEREQPFAAKSLVWQNQTGEYGGEWTFFLRFRSGGTWSFSAIRLDPGTLLPELWTIYNNSLDKETFNSCLSSFCWLSEEFFRSLPAHP
jgi:hypothetical protein